MIQYALTEEELYNRAPSIFTNEPHQRVSDRYQFISTIDIIRTMAEHGWFPYGAKEERARKKELQGFGKHLVIFRQGDAIETRKVGELIPEIALFNDHKGSAAYKLMAALFRMLCENGLIVADCTFGSVYIRHSNSAAQEIVQSSFDIADNVPLIMNDVDRMRHKHLTYHQRVNFADKALQLRFGAEHKFDAEDAIVAKRREDENPSLWHTFNVVQENLFAGGLVGESATGRRTRTRGITNVNDTVGLNQGLWSLAMDELKEAA